MWKDFRSARIKVLEKAADEGKVDEKIVKLLEKINGNPNLVTTSSCFGRIVLLEFDIMKTKKRSVFYKKWHRRVSAEEVELAVSSYGGRLPLWFRVEPFILHVAAKDVKSATGFLEKMRKAGVRRGGIQGIRKDRVTLEVQGTTAMYLPANVFEGSWDELIKIANRMMELNEKQIRKLLRVNW
jgi:tRNA wybutosine-synthesizing protein 3